MKTSELINQITPCRPRQCEWWKKDSYDNVHDLAICHVVNKYEELLFVLANARKILALQDPNSIIVCQIDQAILEAENYSMNDFYYCPCCDKDVPDYFFSEGMCNDCLQQKQLELDILDNIRNDKNYNLVRPTHF